MCSLKEWFTRFPGCVQQVRDILEEAACGSKLGEKLVFKPRAVDVDIMFHSMTVIEDILAKHPGSEEDVLTMLQAAKSAHAEYATTTDEEPLVREGHLPVTGGGSGLARCELDESSGSGGGSGRGSGCLEGGDGPLDGGSATKMETTTETEIETETDLDGVTTLTTIKTTRRTLSPEEKRQIRKEHKRRVRQIAEDYGLGGKPGSGLQPGTTTCVKTTTTTTTSSVKQTPIKWSALVASSVGTDPRPKVTSGAAKTPAVKPDGGAGGVAGKPDGGAGGAKPGVGTCVAIVSAGPASLSMDGRRPQDGVVRVSPPVPSLREKNYLYVPTDPRLGDFLDADTVDILVFSAQCVVNGAPNMELPFPVYAWYIGMMEGRLIIRVKDDGLCDKVAARLSALTMPYVRQGKASSPCVGGRCTFLPPGTIRPDFHAMCRCTWNGIVVPLNNGAVANALTLKEGHVGMEGGAAGAGAGSGGHVPVDSVQRAVKDIKMMVQVKLMGATLGLTSLMPPGSGYTFKVEKLRDEEAARARRRAMAVGSHCDVVKITMADAHLAQHVFEYFSNCQCGSSLLPRPMKDTKLKEVVAVMEKMDGMFSFTRAVYVFV
jgi:hypothetical protein